MLTAASFSSGPFVLGDEVSFADFVLAGAWSFLKDLDRQGDLFDRVMIQHQEFQDHWRACQPFMEKKD